MRRYVAIIGLLIGTSFLSRAYADTITTFDITGTVTPHSPETGTTFTGTLVLDLDFGSVLSGELDFPDLPTLEPSGSGGSSTNESFSFASSGTFPITASLTIPTTAPFSLAGFTGGTFTGTGDRVIRFSPTETFYYDITSFTMTPETTAVPEPGTLTVLLGFGAMVFAARRRRLGGDQ